jgi:small-conductance mechanosensitive channel|tara:strand:+ start:1311 stop:1790 length:480 start_codon:yes stop_codon:yes gene_type:complete
MKEALLGYVPKLGLGFGLFIFFWFTANILKRIVMKLGGNFELDENINNLLGRSLKGLVITVGIISSLGTLGVNVSALVAGLGLTGFALGYALKDSISNLLAGILILLYRPFVVEDRIHVDDNEGIVKHIDLRYTTLENETGKILIPNSKLFTDAITVLK